MTGRPTQLLTVVVALLTVTAVLGPATAGGGTAEPAAGAVMAHAGGGAADTAGVGDAAGGSSAAAGGPSPPDDPPPAGNVTKDHPRIEDGLLDSGGDGRAARPTADGEFVRVVVETEPGAARRVAGLVRRSGGAVEVRVADRVQARVPRVALTALANSEAVMFVRKPHRPRTDDVTSDGVSTVLADEMHAEGYTGENVTVAVIDVGFNLNNSEIADNVVAFNDIGNSTFTNFTGEHGTATSELVVDTAPDANLVIVDIRSATEVLKAITWVENNTDADVVSMSLGFTVSGPLDGTSEMDDRINNSVANGTHWFVSAGNEANGLHLNTTWQDGDADDVMNFTSTDECLNIPSVSEPRNVTVQWNDWEQRNEDYDLRLFNASGAIAGSFNVQNGTSAGPWESVTVLPQDGPTCLTIDEFSANGTADFDVFISGAGLEYATNTRSITIPATNRKVVTVGAMDDHDGVLEAFSSRGPTIDGRRKPDVVAPDNVTTTAKDPFFGTSAAAPHTAGVAAIMLDADPTLAPAESKSTLTGTTSTNVTADEPNRHSGFGLVDAENATLSLSTTPPQSVEITGRFDDAGGSAVVDASVFAFPTLGDGTRLDRTNATGDFRVSPAGSNGNYSLQLYQNNFSDSGGADSFPRDGVVDVFGVDEVAGNASTDLGTVSLPAGHVVNVTVENESGAPVENATVDVTHFNDDTDGHASFGNLETAGDGMIYVGDGGNASGIELAGNVSVTVTPPADGPFVDRTYEQSSNVTSDQELTFTLNETSTNVTITGTIERADGTPAVDDSVDVGGDDVRRRVATDASGNFSVSVPANDTYSVGYYQGNFSTEDLLTSEDDGSPDMYTIDNVNVGTTNVSLGTVSLPTGYNVTVTVRNESGVPVEDALVRLVHSNPAEPGLAFGSGRHPTDAQGRFVLRNADHPGMEMANDTTVRVHPPENDTRFVDTVYEFTPNLSGPLHLNVTLQESDNVTLSGRIVLANGTGANEDRVWISGGNVSEIVVTDGDGNWNLSVPRNTTYSVGYFQGDPDGEFVTGVDDGSPDVFSVRDVAVGDGPRAVGNMTLPDAFVLNVTVVDESGDPVEDAQVSVGHRNTTTGAGFGGANGNTNADGVFEITQGDPGVEIRGQAEVDVNPPSGSDRFVDETVERTVNVSADDGITVELNETSINITQNRAWSTGSGPNQTKLVAIQPDANLTLDNGTSYHFAFTNEDTGQSATLAANGSTTVGPGDSLVFGVYEPDGSVRADPIFHGPSGSLDADVVNNSVPTASGLTNFSVTLLNATTGAAINGTSTEPSVVGYTGVLTQNSTTGQVRLSMPADVLPTTANGTLQLSKDITDGSVEEFAFPMTYDAGSDEFATVVDADNFTSGDYQWEADYDWRGTSLILQVTSPDTNNENVTLESDNVTLTGTLERADGSPAVDDTVRIGGAGLGLEAGTDANGTFSISVPPNATYALGYYQGNHSNGTLENSLDDGSVDVRAIREVTVGTTNRSLGTMTLPAGHNLTVTVVNESGVPVENALVDVFHFNDTAGSGFGTSPTETDAQGRFRHGSPRHVGMETNGTTEVQVEPPTGSDEYVDKVYKTNLNVTNDTHVEVRLNETENVTVIGRVVLDNGSGAVRDRVIVVDDGGADVKREVETDDGGNFSVTVPANDTYLVGYHQSEGVTGPVTSLDDGSPDLFSIRAVTVGSNDRALGDLTLPRGFQLNVSVVDESGDPVPNASVFTVAHRNTTTGFAFGTGSEVNADGLLEFPAADHPGVEMRNRTIVKVDPPDTDRFVDKRYTRVLNLTADDSITIELQEKNVSIEQDHGFTTSGALNTTKIVGVRADANLTLDNGTNYRFRLTDEDSGQSVTLAANGSAELGANDPVGLKVHDRDGFVEDTPKLLLPKQGTNLEADVVNGSIPTSSGTTNFSVTLLNGSGSPINSTATHASVIGYTGVLVQNSTTGDVRLSLPQDVAPKTSNVTLVLSKGDLNDGSPRFEFEMAYESGADEIATVVDASNFSAGNYSWETFFQWRGTSRILQVRSPNSANENVTLENETVTVRGRVVRAGGAPAADDRVVVHPGGEFIDVATNATGWFNATISPNSSFTLGYYQGNVSQGLQVTSEDDGSPDLFTTKHYSVGENDTNLGNVTLPPAHNLTVTVENESGVPVADARVHIRHSNPNESTDSGFGTGGPTDAQGRFVHPDADHPGMEMTNDTIVEVQPPKDDPRFVSKTYRLEPTMDQPRHLTVTLNETDNVTLSGRVVLANGSGASVDRVILANSNVSTTVATDSGGNFSASVPANATYALGYHQGDVPGQHVTSVDDGSPDLFSVGTVTVGGTNASLGTVALPDAFNVNVTVVDESGDPVEDARVHFAHQSDPTGPTFGVGGSSYTTNASGVFVVQGASKPGVEMRNLTHFEVRPPSGSSRFENRSYEKTLNVTAKDNVTFELNETGTTTPTINVTGRAFEADGDAAADDTLFAFVRSDAGSDAELTRTDAGGNFTLSDVNESEPYHLGYYQGNFSEGTAPTFVPNDGSADVWAVEIVNGTSDVDVGDVNVPAGHVVNVTVVNESGVPVENASVSFVHNNSATDARTGLVTSTESDGMVRPNGNDTGIELVGNVTVEVERPRNASRFVNRTYTRQLNVTGPEDLTFELREKHNVTGRLLENDSTAATEDFAVANNGTLGVFDVVPTGSDGNYSMTLPGEGRYGFAFAQKNETSGILTERDGTVDLYTFEDRRVSGEVDLGTRTMPEGHVVNISVVDESGDPVENASVAITSKGDSDDPRRVSLVPNTTAEGVVHINENVTPGIELAGNVTLEVERPDGEERFVNRTYTKQLTVTGARTVEFELQERVNVSGRLFEADGDAAADDRLFAVVRSDAGSDAEFVPTDDTGAFTIRSVNASEPYHVGYYQGNFSAASDPSFMPNDGSPDMYAVDVVNTTSDADLGNVSLPQAHVVNVTVVNESDVPVANATVGFTHNNSANGARTGFLAGTGENGTIRLGNETGMELVGNVTVTVDPPRNATAKGFVNQTYERNLSVTGDTRVNVTLEEIAPLAVTTGEATDVGLSSATLHGNLTGLGGADNATVYFTYWVDGNKSGTQVWRGHQTLTSPGTFSTTVTGLDNDTTYVFGARVESSAGEFAAGSDRTFATPAPFGVTTGQATDVTDTSATLHGNLTGLGGADNATVYFTYWVDGNKSGTQQWQGHQTLTSPGTFSTTLTGLDANTTYVFGARAVSSTDEFAAGSDLTFDTVGPLGVTTGSPTDVTDTTATLHGDLTGLGGADNATVYFTYWVDGNKSGTQVWRGHQTLTSPGTFSTTVTGLDANTTYVFGARVESSTGEFAAGTDRTFTTAVLLDVLTDAPTAVGDTEATLHGNLTGLGGADNATVYFTYWVDGNKSGTQQWQGHQTLTSPGEFSTNVTGLDSNTTYVFGARVVSSTDEYAAGTDRTFTTAVLLEVLTGSTTSVTNSSATLHGNLTGLGGADNATVYFTYWVDGNKSGTQVWRGHQTLTSPGEFSTTITGLDSNTTYVYGARVESSRDEFDAGTDRTFDTA